MSDDEAKTAARQAARRIRRAVLLPWHIVLFVAFLTAYFTGDGFGQIHLDAGYVVIAALALRLSVGLASPVGGALALRLPSLAAWTAWRRQRRGIHPLVPWTTAAVLVTALVAAVSGWSVHGVATQLHAELSDLSMLAVTVHAVAIIAIIAA